MRYRSGSASASKSGAAGADAQEAVQLRLFCFHYGGGSASVFRQWVNHLPPDIELLAVQLPGREGRFSEPFIADLLALAGYLRDALAPFLDKPYVVFGHSLGAIKSFEWLRQVKTAGLPAPLLYMPGGACAPHIAYKAEKLAHLPHREFVEALLEKYQDTLGNVLNNNELANIFIPQLRADFGMLEAYQYYGGATLDCPVLALAGMEEKEVSPGELDAWAEHTTGNFRTQRFSGGHFFIHSAEQDLLGTISLEIQRLLTFMSNT